MRGLGHSLSHGSLTWWAEPAGGGPEVSVLQELSRAKAAALSERGRAEEELLKAKNQVRLEEVRPRPSKASPRSQCPPGGGA